VRRKKLCHGCRIYFRPADDDPKFKNWCSDECGVKVAMKGVIKAKKRQDKKRKGELQPLSHWLKETQAVFNEYIRHRDSGEPCISCGTNKDVQYCAGHYRTRAAASQLRFDERNVHLQCNHHCNLQRSGNIANYRPRLIQKIGLEAVEALENDNKPRSWTREELEEKRKHYRQLIRGME